MNTEQQILDIVRTLLQYLGVSAVDVSMVVDPKTQSSRVSIKTGESAILIGERGARLQALNHLVKRMAEKIAPDFNFSIDVNDYQEKRLEELRGKAKILAERARYFKSSVDMEPMSSYERMVVHAEFADVPDIETTSSGQGPGRHIVLKFTEHKEPKPTTNKHTED